MTVVDPEPCDTCDLGIAKMVCYDGFRRCTNCIEELINERGWGNETSQKGSDEGVAGGGGSPDVAEDDVLGSDLCPEILPREEQAERVDERDDEYEHHEHDDDIPESVASAETEARSEDSLF